MKKLLVLLFVIGLSITALSAQNELMLRVSIGATDYFTRSNIDMRMYDPGNQNPNNFVFYLRGINLNYGESRSFFTSIDIASGTSFVYRYYTLDIWYRTAYGSDPFGSHAESYSIAIPRTATGTQYLHIDPTLGNVHLNGTRLYGREISPW